MTEEGRKEPETGRATRRDALKIGAGILVGAIGGHAIKKSEQPEQATPSQQPESVIDTEAPMLVLPFKVRSFISASVETQNPVDKAFEGKIRTDDQIRGFFFING